ncbi:MAG: hypothetical protein ACHBN1_03720 [Heteroscytonema crispum UTEX LB 1556]
MAAQNLVQSVGHDFTKFLLLYLVRWYGQNHLGLAEIVGVEKISPLSKQS